MIEYISVAVIYSILYLESAIVIFLIVALSAYPNNPTQVSSLYVLLFLLKLIPLII